MGENKAESEGTKAVMGLMPSESIGPYSVVVEVRNCIRHLTDEGTSMDTGGGMGMADMYFTIGGVEYLMVVRRAKDPRP